MATEMVCALSCAEIPVETPSRASMDTVKAVEWRERFERDGKVPTVYETCEVHGLEIDDLEHMFPDGYHRGVVKLAGLRL